MIAQFDTTALGEIAVLHDSLHKTPSYCELGVPMVRVTDIQRGFLDLSNTKKVDEVTYKEFSKKHKPKIGDILFSRVGSYGNSCYVDKEVDFCLGQNTVCIAPEIGKVDPFYFYCCLNSPFIKAQVDSMVGGASQPTISLKNISLIQVPVPSLETQRKIASILSTYDALIENNTRRIKILEEMARMIYREWFVNFRFPGHEKGKMVDSPLGMIPEGWEVVELQKVCHRITDGSHTSPETRSEGYPMASVKDMQVYGLNIQACRKISEEDYFDLVRNDCKVKKDDVLIAKDGSYLKHCFVVENDLDVVLLSSIAMLRPNSYIHPHLLAMILKDPEVKERMKGYVSGVAIPRIVLKDFRAFQVVLPPKDLQDMWGGLVEALIKLIWRINAKNQNLRQTRDLLLPKLISGEVDVAEMNIEIKEDAA